MIGRIGLVLLTCVVACKKERASAPPSPAPEPTVDDSLFIVARPRVTTMAIPTRFTGPLPASVRELERGIHPPQPFIRAALDANTYEMRQRVVAGLTRAAADGSIDDKLASWYGGLAGYSPGKETCTWIVETAAGKLVAPAKAALWRAATHCRFPALAPAFSKDEVPDDVIVEWYFNAFLGEDVQLPFNERVARAAAAYARTADNHFKARQVGFVFARMKGPESVVTITALQQSLTDPHRRAIVGIGMLNSASADGKAIGERACTHPKVADDPMCGRVSPDTTQPPTNARGMLEDGESVTTILSKHPKPAVAAALTDCTKTTKDYRRVRCLRALAAIDRPAAAAVAKSLASDDPRIATMLRSLETFPDLASAEQELVRRGFKLDRPRADEERFDEPEVTLEDTLFARGRSKGFDAETGMFPNEHDELLADLAALAAPALDGVIFEEIPPSRADADADSGSYVLHAYLGGKQYSVDAENHGDWYDVEAVIGLVNALLVANKSDHRLVVLPTGDQTVNVLVGPAIGIRALADARLLDLGKAGAAERAGKEFEDQVLDSIRSGEVLRDVKIEPP
ncbi:MAG: hypothetical protein JWP01_4281 [Myxococcales bacterium]|nr:hypothetical protein [Myxococcales bacterium]